MISLDTLYVQTYLRHKCTLEHVADDVKYCRAHYIVV